MSNRTARTLRPDVAQRRSPLLNCGKQTPPEASGKVAAGPDAEVIPLVTCPTGLLPWREALERRQFVSALHPSDPFGDLNMRAGRNGVGIVVSRALNIDDPR
jgi:hypothetical protein